MSDFRGGCEVWVIGRAYVVNLSVMGSFWISIFMAAGVAGWAYSRFARRVGYGNTRAVWTIVGVAFVLVFLFFWTLLTYVVHL